MGASFGEHWTRTIAEPRIFGCGDTVVQVTTQTWTARVTGRSATVDVVELFSFREGLVSQIRVFQQDTHLLLGTLEAAEAPKTVEAPNAVEEPETVEAPEAAEVPETVEAPEA